MDGFLKWLLVYSDGFLGIWLFVLVEFYKGG